jgi:hypothetical protein
MWHVWERGKLHTGFWSGDQRERDHLDDLSLDGRIILKCICKVWDEVMDWFDLALVNRVMSLRLP